MSRRLLLFRSVHDLIRVERTARRDRLRVQVLPAPRDLSSDCGMVLEIEDTDLALFQEIAVREEVHMKIHPPCSGAEDHGAGML